MKCTCEKTKLVYKGDCTVIVDGKKNAPEIQLEGTFEIRQCAKCKEYQGRML